LQSLVGWHASFYFGYQADLALAGVGGVYEFAKLVSANLREKDDSFNTAIGGFLAGNVLGLRGGSLRQLESGSFLTCCQLAQPLRC